MSLVEKLKNKRYDLQEAPIDDKGNITPEPGEVEKSKKILKKFVNKQKRIEKKNIKSNQEAGEKLKRQISQRRTAQSNQQQIFNRQYDAYDDGDLGNPSQTKSQTSPKVTTGKGVDQAEVSKQAKDFTKKINKERVVKQKNIFGGEDTVKTKRRVGSSTSRGTRTKKIPEVPGQKKLNLGDFTKGKVQTTKKLSKSGEVLDDLRTTGRKPRNIRKRRIDAKPPKPEKMVVAPDPVKGGFKKVGATTTQGREVLKKSVSADELLGDKKISKTVKKPSLFTRTKNALKGFHKFMVKDANYRKTSGSGKMLPDTLGVLAKDKNITRNIFKNTIRGNTFRTINKFLPGKYKALAALATGTYLATRGKKGTGGGAGKGEVKRYKAVEIPMGFDSKSASKKKFYNPDKK